MPKIVGARGLHRTGLNSGKILESFRPEERFSNDEHFVSLLCKCIVPCCDAGQDNRTLFPE
jgi:hypothetical protein